MTHDELKELVAKFGGKSTTTASGTNEKHILTTTDIKFAVIMLKEGLINDPR